VARDPQVRPRRATVSPVVEKIHQAQEILFEPRSVVEFRPLKGG
jgi:hypothetical protein